MDVAAGIAFPHAAQAVQITRRSRPAGTRKWHTETVYAVTSLTNRQGKPVRIGSLVRGHWGIGNGLHWRRDVTSAEDRSQVRTGQAPRVMASLRNLAVTILRLAGETNLAKATRALRARPHQALQLAGITTT